MFLLHLSVDWLHSYEPYRETPMQLEQAGKELQSINENYKRKSLLCSLLILPSFVEHQNKLDVVLSQKAVTKP